MMCSSFNSELYKSIISTTTPRRIRGNTIKIMEILYRFGALSFSEIVKLMDKSKVYVEQYLKNMLKYGIIRREEGIYELTEKGILILERKVNINNFMYNEDIEYKSKYKNKYKNKNKRKNKSNFHDITNVIDHQNIINFIINRVSSKYSLTKNERGVVVLLLNNYFSNASRQKFIFFESVDEMISRFNIDFYELKRALIDLRNKGIIYFGKVMGLFKVGLKSSFVEEVEEVVEKVKG